MVGKGGAVANSKTDESERVKNLEKK